MAFKGKPRGTNHHLLGAPFGNTQEGSFISCTIAMVWSLPPAVGKDLCCLFMLEGRQRADYLYFFLCSIMHAMFKARFQDFQA